MNPAPGGTVRILLSSRARELHAAEIAAVVGARTCAIVDALTCAPDADFDAALVTRDVTGLSTKFVVEPPTQAFHDRLRRAPGLRWVHIHSAGVDRPIYQELMGRGVTVTSSSGANAPIVAQTAVAALLALARELPRLARSQSERRWTPHVGGKLPRDLNGQTAVVVGWGPIGREIGRLLSTLGLRIVVIRESGAPAGEGIETFAFADAARALPKADWLLLACPLTPRTRGFLDAPALALLPAGARVLNVSRGEVAVQADLIEALRSGRLAGAYLDVFEHEPLEADSPLWDLPNVILTPHCAGQSDGNARRVADIFLENLGRWLADESLQYVARP